MYKDIKKRVKQIWNLGEKRTNPPNNEDFRKILNEFSDLKKDLKIV